jgi:hypothetical protein
MRLALRSLLRTPRMFACAVVCLAGAIGAATAVFAIVSGVVLRPLSFQHADRLVAIVSVCPTIDGSAPNRSRHNAWLIVTAD